MAKTITRTVYSFGELSVKAKENARTWFKQDLPYSYDSVFEDVKSIAAIIGIDFADANTESGKAIYFSGFASQGDGACFEGSYSYAKGSKEAIRNHAPQDTTLHAIAEQLYYAQKSNFYTISARLTHRGNYYHSNSVNIDISDKVRPISRIVNHAAADDIEQALRDFMDWIYKELESEYDYLTSDEVTDESLLANEYWFDESGRNVSA